MTNIPDMRNRDMLRRMGYRKAGMTRKEWLQKTGLAAAGAGMAAMGLGGTAKGFGEGSVLPDWCYGIFGGHLNLIPSVEEPFPYPPPPYPPQFMLWNADYNQLIGHWGHFIRCGGFQSGCVPYYPYDVYPDDVDTPLFDYGTATDDFFDLFYDEIDINSNYLIAPYGAPQYAGPAPPPYIFPGLGGFQTWGQAWAYFAAFLGLFGDLSVYRYKINPDGSNGAPANPDNPGFPLSSVDQIPAPSELGDPSFGSLDSFYQPVEFKAFHPWPGEFSLFGYFFNGKGVWKDNKLYRPLVVHYLGLGDLIIGDQDLDFGNRKYVKSFVDAGFNVLLVELPGHGWSGGMTGTITIEMELGVLSQLSEQLGCIRGTNVLKYNPSANPLILSGYSWGAMQNAIFTAAHILAKYPENYPPGLLDNYFFHNSTPEEEIPYLKDSLAGLNLKGIVDIGGLPAGNKFTSAGELRLAAGFRELATNPDLPFGFITPFINPYLIPGMSEVAWTLKDWPALLCVSTIEDWQTSEGSVQAYNLAETTTKGILLLSGGHLFPMVTPNVHYVIHDAITFAKKAATTEPVYDNNQPEATLEQVMCSEAHVRTDLTAVPDPAGPLARWEKKVGKAVGKEIAKHIDQQKLQEWLNNQ